MYELIFLALFSYWALNFCSAVEHGSDVAEKREKAVLPAIIIFSVILWLSSWMVSCNKGRARDEDYEWKTAPRSMPINSEFVKQQRELQDVVSSGWKVLTRMHAEADYQRAMDDYQKASEPLGQYLKKRSLKNKKKDEDAPKVPKQTKKGPEDFDNICLMDDVDEPATVDEVPNEKY